QPPANLLDGRPNLLQRGCDVFRGLATTLDELRDSDRANHIETQFGPWGDDIGMLLAVLGVLILHPPDGPATVPAVYRGEERIQRDGYDATQLLPDSIDSHRCPL